MSRIARDPNSWVGSLNSKGLTPAEIIAAENKTGNTQVQKRFGPLGVAGVGGVVNRGGGEHEAVFELTGDELITEGGVLVTDAFEIQIPADALITAVDLVVHDTFGGGTVTLNHTSQATEGGALAALNLVLAGGNLATRGWQTGLTVVTAGVQDQTFELGGTLSIDLTGITADAASQSGGQAEVIVKYSAL